MSTTPDRAAHCRWPRAGLMLAFLALGAGPAPARPDEPFTEVTLSAPAEFVRAVALGDALHVVVARGGRCFYSTGAPNALGEPLPVDPAGPAVIAGGERGPWLHVSDEALVVLWQHRGGLHLVRSTDRGATWTTVPLAAGAKGVDMPALVGAGQRVRVVWVDGRDGKRAGDAVAGELYLAASDDGGKTFAPEVKLTGSAPGVCPCCQPALALDAQGKLWVAYRSSERNQKEIQLLRVDGGRASAVQVSNDRWQFNGCPMAGPALALAGQGKRAQTVVVWRKEQDLQLATGQALPPRLRAPEPLGAGRAWATAVDGRGHTLLLWGEGERTTAYRELWEGGRSGRLDLAPGGALVGLPEGGFLRLRAGS